MFKFAKRWSILPGHSYKRCCLPYRASIGLSFTVLSRSLSIMPGPIETHPAKKQRMENQKTVIRTLIYHCVASDAHLQVIGTHDGTFHCDEALAVFLLRQTTTYRDAGMLSSFSQMNSLPSYTVLDLRRTRDASILDTCDIVVDVGAVYDESKQRFDHHQRGFEEVFGHGFTTKLSSAGLIYKCVYDAPIILPPLSRVKQTLWTSNHWK